MTDNTQPLALWLAEEISGIHCHTESEARVIAVAADSLCSQHARIAELEAKIKTMAEEHADELMVAHMDGMRAAQPAPQQEAQEPVAWYVTGCGRLLDENEAKAEARHIGGTARAMPLYTAPQADSVLEDAARLKEAVGLLEELAEHDSYSTEYDGRMISLCPECGEQEGEHRPKCAFVRAKTFLAARKQGENHD